MKAVFSKKQLIDTGGGVFGLEVENPLRYDYEGGPGRVMLGGGGGAGKVWLSIQEDGNWECRPRSGGVGAYERFYKIGNNLIAVRPTDVDGAKPPVSYAFVCDGA